MPDPWGEPEAALEGATESIPPNLRKALKAAADNGWALSPTGCTMVARFCKPDDPKVAAFFMRFDLKKTGPDKSSWRFHSAMAHNGQRLTSADCITYIEHPDAINPEPPEESQNDHATPADRLAELVKQPVSIKRWNELQRERESGAKPGAKAGGG